MAAGLRLHLRDLSAALVTAWADAFAGVENVTITRGDIFSDRAGMVQATDPIDVDADADAVVSPANSFGFMDGGIDAVYSHVFGRVVQDRLRSLLAQEHDGELPVGQAVLVPTGNARIRWCVSAPTMRTPTDVSATVNAFLAFRATLRAVREHNAAATRGDQIRTLLCPGLGTAVGRMPPARCARQMRAAWDRVVLGRRFDPRSLREAAEDEEALLR